MSNDPRSHLWQKLIDDQPLAGPTTVFLQAADGGAERATAESGRTRTDFFLGSPNCIRLSGIHAELGLGGPRTGGLPRAGWQPAVPGLGEIATGRLGAGGLGIWGDCHGPAGSRRYLDGRLGAGGSGAGGDCCGPAGGRRFRDGRLMAGGGPKTGRFRQLVGLGLCVRWKRRDASSLRRWCQR